MIEWKKFEDELPRNFERVILFGKKSRLQVIMTFIMKIDGTKLFIFGEGIEPYLSYDIATFSHWHPLGPDPEEI